MPPVHTAVSAWVFQGLHGGSNNLRTIRETLAENYGFNQIAQRCTPKLILLGCSHLDFFPRGYCHENTIDSCFDLRERSRSGSTAGMEALARPEPKRFG
jgi:hypothetical protein